MVGGREHRVLYWVIAFLIMTNLATISTILYHNYQVKKESVEIPKRKYKHGRGYGKHDSQIDKMFSRHLKLDHKQEGQFKSYRTEFSKKAKKLMFSMHKERQQFLNVLANEEVDTIRAKEVAQHIGDMHRQMKMETMLLYMRMDSVCRPDQRKRLVKLFKRFIQRSEFEKEHQKRHRKRNRYGQKEKHREMSNKPVCPNVRAK